MGTTFQKRHRKIDSCGTQSAVLMRHWCIGSPCCLSKGPQFAGIRFWKRAKTRKWKELISKLSSATRSRRNVHFWTYWISMPWSPLAAALQCFA